jgi:hypothetical protein
MALQKMTSIEGLEAFEDVKLLNDTDPGVNQISFSVQSEEMPFLTANPDRIPLEERGDHIDGQVYRKNFVYIQKIINLGNSIIFRRIVDEVKFNKATGKWQVLRLALMMSDIKEYPEAWNAFATGASEDSLGTPLSLMFKNDPARVIYYKSKHIISVEQLSKCNDSDVQTLGLGVREDVAKAKRFVEITKEAAPGIALNAMLDSRDKEIAALKAQNEAMNEKLEMLLDKLNQKPPKIAAKRHRSPNKPKVVETEPISINQTME